MGSFVEKKLYYVVIKKLNPFLIKVIEDRFMKSEWIEIMRRKKRLKLTFVENIGNYSIVIFLLVIPVATIYDLIKSHVTGINNVSRSLSELIFVNLPLVILAIVLAYLQYRRLRLKEIKIFYTPQQLQEAVKRTADELNWDIEENQNDFFIAHSLGNGFGNSMKIITIIKIPGGILINGRNDPFFRPFYFLFGSYKRTINTLLKNLDESIHNIPVKPKANESNFRNECTLEKTFVRFFAYSLCFFLIFISLYIMMNLLTFTSLIIGMIVICLCTVYIFYDLKRIFTKNKK